MRILFVTMDSLEVNSSANLRNCGLIEGMAALGHEVATCSMEKSYDSVHFDNSRNVGKLLKKRYFIKPNFFYEKFRTKKGNVQILEQEEGKQREHKQKRKSNLHLKKYVRKIAKIISHISVFDVQRINANGAHSLNLNLSDYDMVLSSSDPKSAHLIAKHLLHGSKKKIPWVQYWGDPWYNDMTSNDKPWRAQKCKQAEAKLLGQADLIVYTSPFTLKKQKTLFPESADKMIYAVQACLTSSLEKMVKNNDVCLGYFGGYNGKIRNLLPLMQAASELQTKLIIAGDGERRKDPFIEYYPRLEFERMREIQEQVNVVVCVCNRRGTQIPGKIYYESGCQKPIIVIVDGEYKEEMKRFFGSFHRYILCENHMDDIKRAVHRAIKEVREKKAYEVPQQMQPETVAETILKQCKGWSYD